MTYIGIHLYDYPFILPVNLLQARINEEMGRGVLDTTNN